jgi:hypothetical protein
VTALRTAAAIVVGFALGCLSIVHYRFAAPHAGHTHAPAPSAPGKE